MRPNLNVFQEPRGVMRVIQFVFSIWAFAKTVNYVNHVTLTYCSPEVATRLEFSYPYQLDRVSVDLANCNATKGMAFSLVGDFSSDAKFFVTTGELSMLYSIGISVLYVLFDALYESNAKIPMADFLVTLVLAVFWLSGSAAWANGILGMQSVTSPENIMSWKECADISCRTSVGSFSGLNISVTLGFLNFFLWAFDLWFLYKETQWFKSATPTPGASQPGVTVA